MRRNILAVVVLLSAAGCAASTSTGRGPGNRNVLTAAEIRTAQGSTAHEVISQLRPEYLRTRGANSPTNPLPVTAEVYLDGLHFGSIESLGSLRAEQIVRVEYLNASDATTRFGTGHTGGAILISTK